MLPYEHELGHLREANVATRERAVAAREAAVGLREEEMRSRDAQRSADADDAAVIDAAGKERERLVEQMREANENLVLATIRANELADKAEAARAEIAASEERFRSLVTTSAAILFQADGDGRIRVDPSSWRRLTGLDACYEEGQEPGWGWLHAVHPDDQARVREAWTRATSGQQVYTLQHRLRRADGSDIWVMARAVPLRRSGRVREWVGTMTDVSDSVRIEEAREQFIAVLGHDLRNPVSAILLSAEVLLSAEESESARVVAARVARSARRIDAMIHDILDFARGRLGRGIPIECTACDLGHIAAEAVSELRHAHPGRTITCQSSGDVHGEWDSDRVEQVFSNLVGNALEQGPDPVRVVVADAGDEVILSVHNEGRPIAPKVLATIFEPFRRRVGDQARGLGLGLYIVQQIVQAHGATISVTSAEGEGTTFTIRWPRRPPPAAEVTLDPARGDGDPAQDSRIR